jgi:hypothetical protein
MEIQASSALNERNIKRLARKLKGELGIPYNQALEMASRLCGFSNWQHYKNFLNAMPSTISIDTQPLSRLPEPLSIPYQMFPLKGLCKRPNAKMPVEAHFKLATLLLQAIGIASNHKRACKPLGQVRATLDDWVQLEYPTEAELSNQLFANMYFGGGQHHVLTNPTEREKQLFRDNVIQIKSIVCQYYHECQPTKWILDKLTVALVWSETWPKSKPVSNDFRKEASPLQVGTFVRIKKGERLAVVIDYDPVTGIVTCYGHPGRVLAMRFEIVILKEQLKLTEFKPRRLVLPYGVWTFKDGRQILFNRDYFPLWIKEPDGAIHSIDPQERVDKESAITQIFYDGQRLSCENSTKKSSSYRILQEWKVVDRASNLLDRFRLICNPGTTVDLFP